MGSSRQLPALPHSHFPNLLAIVTQNLEESVQDLWQVVKQVNVWHRLQDQDLTKVRRKEELAQAERFSSLCHGPGTWAVKGTLQRQQARALQVFVGE